MVEKVIVKSSSSDLDGAQFENAATEATLKRLVDLMEKQKPGSGANVKNTAQQAQGIAPAVLKETNNAIGATGAAAKEAASGMGSFAAQTVKFLASGPFELLSAGVLFLKDTIGKSMDTLRDTAKNGASFNGSLLELNKAAAGSGMNLDTYSKFIKENKETMASFGGTVTEGAKRLGQMSRDLRRSDAGQQLQALGISAEDISSGMAQYVSTQVASGRIQGKTTAEITAGAAGYVKNLGELSRLTGESVDKLAAKQAEEEREARSVLYLSQLEGTAREEAAAGLTYIGEKNKEASNAFKDAVMGIPNKLGESMMATNKEFAENVRKAQRKEAVTAEDHERAMITQSANFKILSKTTNSAALANDEAFFAQARIQADMEKVAAQNAAKGMELAKKEGDSSASATKALMNFSDAVDASWGRIKEAILNSEVFKKLGDATEWVGRQVLKLMGPLENFFVNIDKNVQPALTMLGSAVTSIKAAFDNLLGPVIRLLPSFDDVMKVLKPVVGVIISAGEAFILVKGAMLAWQGAQALWQGAQAAYHGVVAAGTAIMAAFNAAKGANILSVVASTASMWAASLAAAAFASPVVLWVAGITAAIVLFKTLYDSGWSFGSVLEAVGDNLSRFGIYLMEIVDKVMGALPKAFGGYSDAEIKEKAALRKSQRDELEAKENARDEQRAAVRKERGTEDSLLNLSGPGTSAPQPPTAAAISTGQSLVAASDANKKKDAAVGLSSDADLAAIVEKAKSTAAVQDIAATQAATLNTADGITKLTTIMTAILELQHQQFDAQKDLVNATKGRYNAVG
jgi:hypothetical protein